MDKGKTMDKKEAMSILLHEIDNLLIIARDFVSENMNGGRLEKLEPFIEKLQKCDSDSLVPRPEVLRDSFPNRPERVPKLSNQGKGKYIEGVRKELEEAKEDICESD